MRERSHTACRTGESRPGKVKRGIFRGITPARTIENPRVSCGTARGGLYGMKIGRILALTDLSSHSLAGVVLANRLAQRTGARVTVGYVHTDTAGLARYNPNGPENLNRLAEWVRSEDESHLNEIARQNVDPLRLGTTEMIESESPRDGVATLIEKIKPDLVCMATHGRSGLKHFLLGSVAEHTLRTAGVPVLITRGQQIPSVGEPLTLHLAVDLMDNPQKLAREMAEWMKSGDALHLVHVVESAYFTPAMYGPEATMPQPDVPLLRKAAESQLAQVSLNGEEDTPKLTYEIRTGRPRQDLVDLTEEQHPSILAVRTHGRTGFDRLMLGSVAEFVARRSAHPVLILPKAP